MLNEFSLLITIAIIAFILVIFLLALASSRAVPESEKSDILKQLEDIKYSMTLHNPSSNRDGIVRLDALLSKSLQLKHKNTLNCGENLKKSKNIIGKKYYEEIWFYHKLRNQIVHENVEITDINAVNGYSIYSIVINKLLN